MKLRIVLITAVLVLATYSVRAQSCVIGKDSAAYGFWTWAANTRVKVYVVAADFKEDDLPYLLAPLATWNAALGSTGSGVSFVYSGTVSTSLDCQNCLTIMRGSVYEKSKRHATELRAFSANSNQVLTWGHIVVDPSLTNQKSLTNAVAHELGHNLGLYDCYTCKAKSTLMMQFKSVNKPNDMEGPTPCDLAQVKAAYKELAVRIRPAPVKVETDEGEDPVEDDTPITPRKP